MAKPRYIEDPSIAHVARLEHADMLADLQRRYARGENYYHAREKVMAEHGPRIAATYGKETANRALAALTSYGEIDMPKQVRRQSNDVYLADMERLHHELYGGQWRFSWFQRWLWHTTGHTGLFDTAPKQVVQRLYGQALQEHRDRIQARREAALDRQWEAERRRKEAEETRRKEEAETRRMLQRFATDLQRQQKKKAEHDAEVAFYLSRCTKRADLP